jgi:hypothetical protein
MNSIQILQISFLIFASSFIIIFAVFYFLLKRKHNIKQQLVSEDYSNLDLIATTIKDDKFLVFLYLNEKTLIKPIEIIKDKILGYCFIKNINKEFEISELKNIVIKDSAYSIEYSFYDDGLGNIKKILNQASNAKQLVCIRYQRPSKPDLQVNSLTGKRYFNGLKRGEVSIRTIGLIQNITNKNISQIEYITAFCNTKEEERTFKINRIKKVSVLNI